MRKRSKAFASGVGLVAAASVIAACSSSGSSSSGGSGNSGSTSLSSGTQGINPGSGSPKSGGTLNMLGTGDVDFMDPNISYYTIGYLGQRPWIRGLYAYPATPGQTTSPALDLATAPPVISNGGKTYTITLRTGAMWDTSPARAVTTADAILGLKRACNPVQPFGGLPDFESLIAGYAQFCGGFAKVGPHHGRDQVVHRRAPDLRGHGLRADPHLQPGPPGVLLPRHVTLPAFNPAPVESLQYVPASAASQQHPSPTARTPYRATPRPGTSPSCVTRCGRRVRTRSARPTSTRSWSPRRATSRPISRSCRPTPPARAWNSTRSRRSRGTGPRSRDAAGPEPQLQHGPVSTRPTPRSFNTVSPNNGGALAKVQVRQALSYGLDRRT